MGLHLLPLATIVISLTGLIHQCQSLPVANPEGQYDETSYTHDPKPGLASIEYEGVIYKASAQQPAPQYTEVQYAPPPPQQNQPPQQYRETHYASPPPQQVQYSERNYTPTGAQAHPTPQYAAAPQRRQQSSQPNYVPVSEAMVNLDEFFKVVDTNQRPMTPVRRPQPSLSPIIPRRPRTFIDAEDHALETAIYDYAILEAGEHSYEEPSPPSSSQQTYASGVPVDTGSSTSVTVEEESVEVAEKPSDEKEEARKAQEKKEEKKKEEERTAKSALDDYYRYFSNYYYGSQVPGAYGYNNPYYQYGYGAYGGYGYQPYSWYPQTAQNYHGYGVQGPNAYGNPYYGYPQQPPTTALPPYGVAPPVPPVPPSYQPPISPPVPNYPPPYGPAAYGGGYGGYWP